MKRNHPPDPSRCGRSHRLFTCTHIRVINASDVTDLVTQTHLSESSSPSCKHPHTQPKHPSKNTQLSPTHTLTHRTDMQPCNLHDSEHVCNYTACVRRSTLKHQRQLLQLSPPRTRAWMSICHVFIFPIPKLFSLCDSILAHVFSYNPVGCTREEKRTRKQDFNAQKSRVLSPDRQHGTIKCASIWIILAVGVQMLISAPCYYPGLFADLHHDNHCGADWKARLALWTTAGDVDFGAQVFYQTKTASSALRRANEDTVIVGIQLNVDEKPDLLSVSAHLSTRTRLYKGSGDREHCLFY